MHIHHHRTSCSSESVTNPQFSDKRSVKFDLPEITDEELDAFCKAQRESQPAVSKERMRRTSIYCAPVNRSDPKDT
jgi:transposase